MGTSRLIRQYGEVILNEANAEVFDEREDFNYDYNNLYSINDALCEYVEDVLKSI